MKSIIQEVKEAADFIIRETGRSGRIGIVLGTGLDALVGQLSDPISLSYKETPNFPIPTSPTHLGKIFHGHLGNVPVWIMAGRFHYYEGHTLRGITLPVRVLKALGVDVVLFSNAAGAVNPDYNVGDLVFIKDHINMFPVNPLRGPNHEELGSRFPDMYQAYNPEILSKGLELANELGIPASSGIYVGLQGPSLETSAEYKFMHHIGGDLVGMSTVPEVIVARHSGLHVAAISIVTNVCYPPEIVKPTSAKEVISNAKKAAPKLQQLVLSLVNEIPSILNF